MTIFQQLRDSISVVDYLRNKGYIVKQIGSGYTATECPFCKGHNCFRIFDSGRRWSCFQCPDRKIGKDVLDLEFYFSISGSYKEAIKILAGSLGVEYSQDELLITSLEVKNAALEYFHSNLFSEFGTQKEFNLLFKGQQYLGTLWDYITGLRKHSEQVIRDAKIGVSDGMLIEYLVTKGFQLKEIRAGGLVKNDKDLFREGLILFPQFVNGKISHFTCKDPLGKYDPFQTEARFRDEGWKFYNQDFLLDIEVEDKSVILVEGENDLLSVVYKGGIKNCIGMIGNISDVQVEKLRELSKAGWSLVTAFDGDEQGKQYRNTIIERVGGNIYDIGIREDGIPEGKDIDDILCEAENPINRMSELLNSVSIDPKIYPLKKKANVVVKTEEKKDKIPYSLEHERFILRNLIRGDNLIYIFDRIRSEDWFYKNLYKEMFKELKNLFERGMTINELVSYSLFKDTKVIKDDEEYDSIMKEAFDSDVISAIDILEKKLRRRNLLIFANDIQKQVEDDSIEIDVVEDKTSTNFFSLYKIRDISSLEISSSNILEIQFSSDRPYKLIGTPYNDLNEAMVIGFDAGNLVIIAGRPGMGKSIFKTNLKYYWCSNGIGVLDFSPENRLLMEQARLDSLITGIGFKKIWYRTKGDMIDIQCQLAHERIAKENWPLWQFEELEHLDFGFIGRKVMQAKKERPDIEYWVVIVDLADKVKEYESRGDKGFAKIGVANKKIKILSRRLGFCFVPIVQIGRGLEHEKKLERRKPTLAGLRESGHWEQDADGIFLLYREKYYDESIETDLIEIKLAKQRGGPPCIVFKLFGEDLIKIEDTNITGESNEELPPQE